VKKPFKRETRIEPPKKQKREERINIPKTITKELEPEPKPKQVAKEKEPSEEKEMVFYDKTDKSKMIPSTEFSSGRISFD
jgi:hypothetical protein